MTFSSVATLALASEDGIIRAPIIRNPRQGNALEVARKRYQAMQKRADGYGAPLFNDQGSQYLINVDIGSPAQTFAVTLDTGSGFKEAIDGLPSKDIIKQLRNTDDVPVTTL
ncbi:hypothetical protein INT48_002112, partial [Thamnidium elegans]